MSQRLLIHQFKAHTGDYFRSGCVTPDSKHVVSVSEGGKFRHFDQTLRITRIRDGKLVRKIKGHSGEERFINVCVTPDSKYVLSASIDNTIRVTRFGDGELFREITGHITMSLVFV